MAEKLQDMIALSKALTLGLSEDREHWKKYLTAAARLYKYPFAEQLLIYGQRPDATACAPTRIWNERMGRWVNQYARGIALLDDSGSKTRLKYVFDLSDTHPGRSHPKRPYLWQLKEAQYELIVEGLVQVFEVSETEDVSVMGIMAEQDGEHKTARDVTVEKLLAITALVMEDHSLDYVEELERVREGSPLEQLEEQNVRERFLQTLFYSVSYMVLSRCDLQPERYLDEKKLEDLSLFNTFDTMMVLGSATSELSKTILLEIGRTMANLELGQKFANKSKTTYSEAIASEQTKSKSEEAVKDDGTDLHTEGRLSVPRSHFVRPGGTAAGQIWKDAEALSETESQGNVQPAVIVRQVRSPSAGDRMDGAEPDGAADEGDVQDLSGGRSAERSQPDGMGGSNEQSPENGGGDHFTGNDLWRIEGEQEADSEELTAFFHREEATKSQQLSLFDTAAPVIERNEQEKVAATIRKPQLSWQIIDEALSIGANDKNSRLIICAYFMKAHSLEENAAFLKKHYGENGVGFYVEEQPYAMWYNAEGLRVAGGNTALNRFATFLTWEEAAGRIQTLLEQGRYLPAEELSHVSEYERQALANRLILAVRDFSEKAEKAGYVLGIRRMLSECSGFPEQEDQLALRLMERQALQEITEEWSVFVRAYEEDRELMRFRFHRPQEILAQLQDLQKEPLTFLSNETEIPSRKFFITNDEIDQVLRGGQDYRLGVYAFYATHSDGAERETYLKRYHGEYSGFYNGNDSCTYTSKGLTFSHGDISEPYASTALSWKKIAKRIDTLITKEQFLQKEDYAAMAEYELRELSKSIHGFFIDVPEEIPKPFQVDSIAGYEAGVQEILGQLKEPGRAEEIYQTMMQPLWERTSKEDRYYQSRKAGMEAIEAYRNGTYSIYGREKTLWTHPTGEIATAELLPEAEVQPVVEEPSEQSGEDPGRTWEEKADPLRQNFRITDLQLGQGTAKEKYRANVTAIRLLKQLGEEGRLAGPREQEQLSRYVGWGSLPMAFDEANTAWRQEYQELKTLLTEQEYAAARAATLNAHYTSPIIIKAIYQVLENMGFQTGNVLEPSCGTGNFLGLLPDSMENAKLYGVELEPITGGIAKQLYPDADISICGFEEIQYPDNFFDIAVGNVPFGRYQVADKRYDKLKFSIHDYFFAKTMDQVRPGGVIAFITSHYTMDKQSQEVRRYLAQRAELLGAIRLPNTAFKANAGAEIVADILFLQKRDHAVDLEPDWVYLDQTEEGIPVNRYFAEHPEQVLGKLVMKSSPYGREECTCVPIPEESLSESLERAVKNIKGVFLETDAYDLNREPEEDWIPAEPDVRNFSYTIEQNQIYYRENSRMYPVAMSVTAAERVKGMIAIRDLVRKLIDLQLEDATDEQIQTQQKFLNASYDAFTNRYGLLTSRANAATFREDSSYPLLCSLEHLDENGNLKRKADLFFKRTIRPDRPITYVETASEALAVSLAEKACVDLPYMQSLLKDTSIEAVIQSLEGVIFKNPLADHDITAGWQTADEYLSGNVRQKLRIAELAAEQDARYQGNVEALKRVQPEALSAAEIQVRLGTTWIPQEVIQQFMYELLHTSLIAQRDIKVLYFKQTAEWKITHKTWDQGNVQVNSVYGTERANAYRILEDTLNLRDVRIFDVVEDGEGKKQSVLNKNETIIAQGKQEQIKQAFTDWIWKDVDRRNQLVQRYNELFNNSRPREYDGSHIRFVGMNPEIKLRSHQKNAVARILYGGNTLLAHVVGAGKTFEMVAAAQESKRLGLCHKSLFVVPNHLIEQWASEYLQLYPSANILVARKKDFQKENRKRFCARIAAGDYDAVIIGHSQFEKIPMSTAYQERFIRQQIDDIIDGIALLKEQEGERFQIKAMERSRKNLEIKLERLLDDSRKDDVVTFEELGIDRIFVDEAHYYKNLAAYTKMRNVAGISQTEAQKSSDLFMKCRYLDEATGGRGTIFATGTPISNSMVELYTLQRYLQYHALEERELTHFDCWASTFGETVTAMELSPEGTGYRAKTRFARFFNLPELMTLFREVADVQTTDMLKLPVPEAQYHTVTVEPSALQREMVAALSERAEAVRNRLVKPEEDNMLNITNDGRKLALDQRVLNPLLPDEPESKVSVCAETVYRIWEETKQQRSTQLIFSDLSTPSTKSVDTELFQNVYVDIRNKLLKKGVPKEEIAFIHDADTDIKKKELFARVRAGMVRILLGSTVKMGAGTNVQDRLIALHDLDCPWRPSDLEQRSGRIVRQGNQNKEVHIFRYVTKDTFDSYLWQTVENKQKFISQIMTSKLAVRAAEDIDGAALSYAEIKMLATGNSLIKEKMELEVAVSKLRLLKSSHLNQRYHLEDQLRQYYPVKIRKLREEIAGREQDVVHLKAHTPTPSEQFPPMLLGGMTYTDKKEAGLELLRSCEQPSITPREIGSYRGFQMEIFFVPRENACVLLLKNALTYSVALGKDPLGNLVRIDNKLEQIEKDLYKEKRNLENLLQQQKNAEEQVQVPFGQEEELKEKQTRLEELNVLLNMEQKEIIVEETDVPDSCTRAKKKGCALER